MLTHKELGFIFRIIGIACDSWTVPYEFSYDKTKMELLLRVTESGVKYNSCVVQLFSSIIYTQAWIWSLTLGESPGRKVV